MKRVTMQEIADALSITKVSVSKALNNQPGVSDQLRKKIVETASEMGYVGTKRFGAREKAAALDRHYCFAYIVPKRFFLESDRFYNVISYNLNKICMRNFHQLYSFVISPSEEEQLDLPQNLISGSFDGIFILGELREAYVEKLRQFNKNLVAIDFNYPGMVIDSVIPDNYSISYSLTSSLIHKGHKKIGFVGNITSGNNIIDRFLGYQKALIKNNLPVNPDWFVVNSNKNSLFTLDFDLPDDMPTAFVCHCDMAAYYLLHKLQSQSIPVPEAVSIVSFDNTELSSICEPSLTTVNIDKQKCASIAYDMMLNRIINPSSKIQKELLSCDIVERDSVISLL